MSRPTPSVPDPGLLGPKPFGSGEMANVLRLDTLVIGLSGGADSVSLLHSLVRLRKWLGAKPPFGLVAAHFNHGMRNAVEADGDERFSEALCKTLSVPFFSEKADVPSEARKTGESPEMAARRMRRGYLVRVAHRVGAVAIATGHTLDDQAELFFIRLKRGASCGALGGMRPLAPWPGNPALYALKPLLAVRHCALCQWLQTECLEWREDATNARLDTDRNKIRHGVLPELERVFGPQFFDTLGRTMASLRDAADVIADSASTAPDPLSPPVEAGGAAAAAAAWKKVPRAVARLRIAEALYALGADPERVSADAIDRICGILSRIGGGTVQLGDGVSAVVRRFSLSLRR